MNFCERRPQGTQPRNIQDRYTVTQVSDYRKVSDRTWQSTQCYWPYWYYHRVNVERASMEWYCIYSLKITDIFKILLRQWYHPFIPTFKRFWYVTAKILLYYVMTGFRYYNELIRLKSIEYLWWDYLIFPNRIKQWLVLVTKIKNN